MPGVKVGVYAGEQTAGTEVSSTYEGRHLTVLESELTHPFIADGFVNKGDPVVLHDDGVPASYGVAVGVAFESATAATDRIALDTEGIWNLQVYAEDDGGNVAIEIGDALYIRAGSLAGAASADGLGDAEISKIRDNSTQVPFGYALGSMVSGGSGIIAVKVHFDPISHTLLDDELLYFGDGQDYTMEWNKTFMSIVASAASKIVGEEFAIAAGALADGYGFKETNFNVAGQATGYVAGDSTWLNLGATFKAQLGGGLVTPHTDGIYMNAAAEITGAVIALGGKFTDQMDESDMTWYTMWNLNLTQTMDAIYEVNNPALIGFTAGAPTGTLGSIPFYSTGAGAGHIGYIFIYQSPA